MGRDMLCNRAHPLYHCRHSGRLGREHAAERFQGARVPEELLWLMWQRRRKKLLQKRLQPPQHPCHQPINQMPLPQVLRLLERARPQHGSNSSTFRDPRCATATLSIEWWVTGPQGFVCRTRGGTRGDAGLLRYSPGGHREALLLRCASATELMTASRK